MLAAAITLGPSPASIPGTHLKLGQPLGVVDSLLGSRGAPADAQGHAQRQSRLRFFGLASDAALDFTGGVLATASFEVATPSAHTLDYIADQMRRSGYRGGCIEQQSLSCDWTGAVSITLTANDQHLTARVRRRDPDPGAAPDSPAPDSVAPATPAPAGPPLLADTLTAMLPGVIAPPGLRTAQIRSLDVELRYPPAARSAGVQGVVRVLVLVNPDGTVREASVLRSIPELDAAALDVARGARFEPILVDGRPARFYARLAIPFTVR
jgi:TonB family protein